ncbi:MAG TPA: aquaporin Z [Marmoricola sp.]|nr:aquaporin Z [Marmoricola sp.]
MATDNQPTTAQKALAEVIGTFVLVFGGCGAAVLSAKFLTADGKYNLGIGLLGVALAFGLTVLTMAYAVGHFSGGHFNPAVTLGVFLGKRMPAKDLPAYWAAQLVGGLLAGGVLYLVASGAKGFSIDNTQAGAFATNGYGDHSPGGYSLMACLLIEVVLTAVFLWVILGVTDVRAPKGFAPLAIGLALTLIHLVSIPVTNTSVNPARSLGVAAYAGGTPLTQVWLFFLAPLLGAAIAGIGYRTLLGKGADLEPAMEG